MHFCEKCDNMYYIKLNKEDSNTLIYYCRNCGNEKTDLTKENICVLDIDLKKSEKSYNSVVNEFSKYDPTLPHITHIQCPNPDCIVNKTIEAQGENTEGVETTESDDKKVKNDIIYMRYDDENMKYLYVCKHCDFTWKSNNLN